MTQYASSCQCQPYSKSMNKNTSVYVNMLSRTDGINKMYTYASPFSTSAAWNVSPWFTKSRRRKLGLRLPPSGAQPRALFRILSNSKG